MQWLNTSVTHAAKYKADLYKYGFQMVIYKMLANTEGSLMSSTVFVNTSARYSLCHHIDNRVSSWRMKRLICLAWPFASTLDVSWARLLCSAKYGIVHSKK